MKQKRKRCLVLRMVSSSNPLRHAQNLLKIQRKSSQKTDWKKIELMKDQNDENFYQKQ